MIQNLMILRNLKRPPGSPTRAESESFVKNGRETPASPAHWSHVVRNLDVMSRKEHMEAKRDVAVKRWFDLLASFRVEFQDFQLVSQLHKLCNIDHQLRMLRDSLSGKSPQALLRYSQYLASTQVNFPGDEQDMYQFFGEMRADSAPSSKLQGVVEDYGKQADLLAILFRELMELCDPLLSARCGLHEVGCRMSPWTFGTD